MKDITVEQVKKIEALKEFHRAKAEDFGARAASCEPKKPEDNPAGAEMSNTTIDFLWNQQRQHAEWVELINLLHEGYKYIA